eukprot:14640168-Alexandrium_andersonii.AAC.1
MDDPAGPRPPLSRDRCSCGKGWYVGQGRCTNPECTDPEGPGRRIQRARGVYPAPSIPLAHPHPALVQWPQAAPQGPPQQAQAQRRRASCSPPARPPTRADQDAQSCC